MASLVVPIAYLTIVFGSLFIFIHFYRKHKSSQVVEAYFPPHFERNTYVTLLQMTDPPASDALLKAALVRRAVADVKRVMRIREDKAALQNLLQKGCVGDDLYNSLLSAEKEMEAEIVEVITEANSFVEGWGQIIFPTANEIIANEKIRETFERTPQLKSELETRYDIKAKDTTSTSIPVSITMGPGNAPPSVSVQNASVNGVQPSNANASAESEDEATSPKRGSKNKRGKKRK